MIYETLKERRLNLGLTQAQLSQFSGVSVPTIQNIEAGRANVEWSTLSALVDSLGLELSWHSVAPQWAELYLCGLPISYEGTPAKGSPSLDRLNRAVAKLLPAELDDRERVALESLALALANHFKESFRSYRRIYQPWIPKLVTDKHIKLYRIARAKLSEYL